MMTAKPPYFLLDWLLLAVLAAFVIGAAIWMWSLNFEDSLARHSNTPERSLVRICADGSLIFRRTDGRLEVSRFKDILFAPDVTIEQTCAR